MVLKCKNCGEPIVRFPLKDNEGRFLWKNLFKMSLDSIILVIIVTAMIIAYKHDIAKCNELIEDPVGYCNKTNACKVLEQLNNPNTISYIDPAGINIFDEDLIDWDK